MNIYFVRHAQSEGNISKLEHHDGVRLTGEGKAQAEILAKRLKNLPVEIILSSTYERTRQTADIINKELGKEIVYSDALVERRIASSVIGKHTLSEEVKTLYNLLRANFKKENARHSDEENFEDLKARAAKALEFIKSQPHENVLVVTHGSFLRAMLAYMVFGKDLTGHEFAQMHRGFNNNNTGITLAEHKTPSSIFENEWIIRIWNDHAHLGEIK
jgi:broad specificity phosphatase PhoE